MQIINDQNHTLPFLATADHFLPLGKRQLRGSSMVFSNTIREALHAGGFWLVMQDSDGQVAVSGGDIVTYAHITNIDWLSGTQIQVDVDLKAWGCIEDQVQFNPPRLCAKIIPLWTTNQKLPENDILFVRLKQWLAEYGYQSPLMVDTSADFRDPCWLCWRWLELLPLPLKIKQRLLKRTNPKLCLRYLKIIIHQSDLYTQVLR
ncbi:hypothetical protein MD588_08220 [Photobacterium sp. SDRW27]|uniref:hypothetical protein n=1 Tax=Photobacterium obscurum TaxID=2829490 RepID=UPI002244D92D|nr:hypothetical protein [Photobacterium obscurum]MCW8328793.1 hypothetical protein [Photobacterium obscurum]